MIAVRGGIEIGRELIHADWPALTAVLKDGRIRPLLDQLQRTRSRLGELGELGWCGDCGSRGTGCYIEVRITGEGLINGE